MCWDHLMLWDSLPKQIQAQGSLINYLWSIIQLQMQNYYIRFLTLVQDFPSTSKIRRKTHVLCVFSSICSAHWCGLASHSHCLPEAHRSRADGMMVFLTAGAQLSLVKALEQLITLLGAPGPPIVKSIPPLPWMAGWPCACLILFSLFFPLLASWSCWVCVMQDMLVSRLCKKVRIFNIYMYVCMYKLMYFFHLLARGLEAGEREIFHLLIHPPKKSTITWAGPSWGQESKFYLCFLCTW